jgi:hypothetical protein
MSVSLKFSNQSYLTFGSTVTVPSNADFAFKYKVTYPSIGQLLNTDASGQYFVKINNTTTILMRFGSNTCYFSLDTAIVVGETYVFSIVRRSGVLSIVDESDASLGSASANITDSFTFTRFGRNTSGTFFNLFTGELFYFKYYSDADQATLVGEWDASNSDINSTGSQPVLVDSIGSNNATGVNFPTDGSAWVDLGGEPTPTTHTADLEKNIISISSDNFTGQQLVTASLLTNTTGLLVDNVTAQQSVIASLLENSVSITLDSFSGFQSVTANALTNNISIVMDNFTIDDGTTIHVATIEKNTIAIGIDSIGATQSVTSNISKNTIDINMDSVNAYQSLVSGIEKATVGIELDNITAHQTIDTTFDKNVISTAIDNFAGYQSATANILSNIVNIVIDNVIVYSEQLASLDLKAITFSVVGDGYSFVATNDVYTFEVNQETYEVS